MRFGLLVVAVALAMSSCDGAGTSDAANSTVAVTTVTTTAPAVTTTQTKATEAPAVPSTAFGIRQARYVPSRWTIQSVSPDATVAVIADGEHVGLLSLDGSDPLEVSTPSDFSLGRLVGGWSGDGTVVAFHDAVSTAVEFDSTIWLLDTREQLVRLLASEQDFVAFDVAVAPDGTVTASGNMTGRGRGMFTVTESGELRPLAPTALGSSMEWLPDGSSLLMTAMSDALGLWKVDPVDGSSDIIVPADDVLGNPYLVAVSSDSAWALVYYRSYVAQEGFPPNVSHYGLVRLETGQISPLKERADHDFVGPGLAVFSPDGEWVAYTFHDGPGMDAPVALAIRPTAGGDEQIISSDLFSHVGSPPAPNLLIPDLLPVWGGNDRIVLPTRTWVLVIDLD